MTLDDECFWGSTITFVTRYIEEPLPLDPTESISSGRMATELRSMSHLSAARRGTSATGLLLGLEPDEAQELTATCVCFVLCSSSSPPTFSPHHMIHLAQQRQRLRIPTLAVPPVVAVLLICTTIAAALGCGGFPTQCQQCCGETLESETPISACDTAFEGGPAHCCGTLGELSYCCPITAACRLRGPRYKCTTIKQSTMASATHEPVTAFS